MSEITQLPVTNQQLGAQHELNRASDPYQSYDPSQPKYAPVHEVPLHMASDNWLASQIENSQEPLVSVNESGEHILSADKLEANLDDLGSWIDSDLRKLKDAVKDPSIARKAILADLGEEVPEFVPNGNLEPEEIYDYLDTLKQSDSQEDPTENAMHATSLGVVTALVVDWETKLIEGPGKARRTGPIKVDMHSKPVEELGSFGTHLSRERGRIESRFHEINHQKIQDLGEAALDAAGLRDRVGDIDNQNSPELQKLLNDPDSVDKILVDSENEYRSSVLGPLVSKANKVDTVGNRRAVKHAEATLVGYDRLLDQVNDWRKSLDDGNTVDFGTFMNSRQAKQQVLKAKYNDSSKPAPPEVVQQIDDFDEAWEAFAGDQSYSFQNVAKASAAGAVNPSSKAA